MDEAGGDHVPAAQQAAGVNDPQLQAFLQALTGILDRQPGGQAAPPAPDDIDDQYPSARAREEVNILNQSVLNLQPEPVEGGRPRLQIPQFSSLPQTATVTEFLFKFYTVGALSGFLENPQQGASIMVSYLTGTAFRFWESLEQNVQTDYRLLAAALLERYKFKSAMDISLELQGMRYTTDQPFESYVSSWEYLAERLNIGKEVGVVLFCESFPDPIRRKLLEYAPTTFTEAVARARHLLSLERRDKSTMILANAEPQSNPATEQPSVNANLATISDNSEKMSSSLSTLNESIACLSEKVQTLNMEPRSSRSQSRDKRVRFEVDRSRSRSRSRSPIYDRYDRSPTRYREYSPGRGRPWNFRYRGRGRNNFRNFGPRGRGNFFRQNSQPRSSKNNSQIQCWWCNQLGHPMVRCPSRVEQLN